MHWKLSLENRSFKSIGLVIYVEYLNIARKSVEDTLPSIPHNTRNKFRFTAFCLKSSLLSFPIYE